MKADDPRRAYSLQDLISALRTVGLKDYERQMLSIIVHRKEIDMTQLANLMGWRSYRVCNLRLGQLAKRLAKEMGVKKKKESHVWLGVIGDMKFDKLTRRWFLTTAPLLEQALRGM